jgi:hypothetical protein
MSVELAVMAALSAAQGVSSLIGGSSARRKQRRAARQRAALMRRDAEVERETARRLLGSQQAAYGAAGVNPNTGSALDVQFQTMQDSIRDQERILAGAAIAQKEGYLQADLSRSAGISGGVSGATQALGYLYDFRRARK